MSSAAEDLGAEFDQRRSPQGFKVVLVLVVRTLVTVRFV